MKKTALLILFLLELNLSAQNISSSKWTDLFSYNNVLAIREDHGKLIAATENGLFFYTPSTGEISKLSKANGLHEVKISAFDYNPETRIGLVGYRNGSLDIITPDGITYVVDIPVATGYTGNKTIKHISITGNLAVISVGYGVSIFRLDKKEFGQTCFFPGGVNEALIIGDTEENRKVFAATSNGLKSKELKDSVIDFPIFSTWNNVANGDLTQLSKGAGMAYSTNTRVFYGNGTTFNPLSQLFFAVKDVTVTDQNIIVTDIKQVYVFDLTGNQVKTYLVNENLNTGIFSNSTIYAGSQFSGILNEQGENLKPDGPYSNTSYKINIVQNQVVISSGGRDSYNSPIYNNLGYYHFDGSKWNYPDYFNSFSGPLNVMDAVINPAKLTEIFFSNFTYVDDNLGIYRMENNQFKKKYASTGTYYNRIVGFSYDENNQLFASAWYNSIAPAGGGKISFYLYNTSSDSFSVVEVVSGYWVQKPLTKSGILYIPSPFTGGGLLMYDYNNTPSQLNDDQAKILKTANNLPADKVVSVAVDNNDEVWIGTEKGLRTISNPSAVIDEDNPKAEPIIIEENGVGEELFRDSEILQIEVDSGNQKWVSVNGGGIFYLSANGEKTLNQFNRSNSPLPTNSVTDIKVDNATGKVYFVTRDGVVVYQGDVLTVTEKFGDVLVYPNPVVYAQYKGNVRIRGLAAKTNIRITDAAGNLVNQAVARGGSYEWNLLNHRGVRVASGIYFVLMTNEDGTDKATAKIAVVN